VTTGDINPARRFVREGGSTAIASSGVTHTVTIELWYSSFRHREAVAWALRQHMAAHGLASHWLAENAFEVESYTRRDGLRQTDLRICCKPDSVEAVRQLAADAIKSVLGGGK
jgi:hypothetical protein